jgi:hypothetical protein
LATTTSEPSSRRSASFTKWHSPSLSSYARRIS